MAISYIQFVQNIKAYVCLNKLKDLPFYNEIKNKFSNIDTYVLEHAYQISYIGGGSCWDEGESKHYTQTCDVTEEDRKFVELLNLLDLIAPNLLFKQYSEITNLIKTGYYTEYEYYGNSSDWVFIYVELELVYNKLVEFGYLNESL